MRISADESAGLHAEAGNYNICSRREAARTCWQQCVVIRPRTQVSETHHSNYSQCPRVWIVHLQRQTDRYRSLNLRLATFLQTYWSGRQRERERETDRPRTLPLLVQLPWSDVTASRLPSKPCLDLERSCCVLTLQIYSTLAISLRLFFLSFSKKRERVIWRLNVPMNTQ